MIFCPIIDGSDFWASEIAENSRNKGSKFSHNSWSKADNYFPEKKTGFFNTLVGFFSRGR